MEKTSVLSYRCQWRIFRVLLWTQFLLLKLLIVILQLAHHST
ncbi:MAG: hypothetical protein AB7F86_20070 [Bdellovibrionales bacterium]